MKDLFDYAGGEQSAAEGYAEDGTLLDYAPATGEWIDRRKDHGEVQDQG